MIANVWLKTLSGAALTAMLGGCGSTDGTPAPLEDASAGSAGDSAVEHDAVQCVPGATRCEGPTPQSCDANGEWKTCSACPFLYSDEHNCGACGHDCHGTGCAAGMCESVVLISFMHFATNIAVDETSVYWGTLGKPSPYDGIVTKMPSNGGEAVVLASGNSLATRIAIDTSNVYWTSETSVMKVAKNGGTPAEMSTEKGFGITVDPSNAYWTGANVMKVGLAGGTPEMLATQQWGSTSIVVDESSVYWVACPGAATTASSNLLKVGLNGGAALTLVSVANDHSPFTDVAVDATSVFWSMMDWETGNGMVMKAGLNGDAPVVLASGQSPTAIAIDKTSAYWINSTGTVMKVGLNGGTAVTLASFDVGYKGSGVSIAVDATSVYYYWSDFINYGYIAKVAK